MSAVLFRLEEVHEHNQLDPLEWCSVKIMPKYCDCIYDGAFELHWNGNVVILTKFPSLSAPEVVKMTTSGTAIDENFVKMFSDRLHL